MKAWRGLAIGVGLLASMVSHAQEPVYKCSDRSYAQHPCSARLVDTRDAPVPASRSVPAENQRPTTLALRRLPGESDAQLATRRNRLALAAPERQECTRLDRHIAVEVARLGSGPAAGEGSDADDALERSNRRYRELGC